MSFDADCFLKLCKELRSMGAAQVEGYGFKAIFPLPADAPRSVVVPPAADKKPKQAKRDPKREIAERATDEQLREAAYDKELGR